VLLLWNAPILTTILVHCALGALIATAFAFAGLATRALSRSGAIATIVIGALAYGFGNVALAAALVVFFLSGSVLGRIESAQSASARRESAKGSRRDAAQVLANGGIAVACALASTVATLLRPALSTPFLLAAIGAVAAAAGDTWSTEIGTFAGKSPRSILTLRPVVPGASGGVTLLGILAAPLGGLLVGIAAWTFDRFEPARVWVTIGLVSGLVGSLLDSTLGAGAQGVWRCGSCGSRMEIATQHCGQPGQLVHGVRWLDNDGVNALATLGGALTAFILALALS